MRSSRNFTETPPDFNHVVYGITRKIDKIRKKRNDLDDYSNDFYKRNHTFLAKRKKAIIDAFLSAADRAITKYYQSSAAPVSEQRDMAKAELWDNLLNCFEQVVFRDLACLSLRRNMNKELALCGMAVGSVATGMAIPLTIFGAGVWASGAKFSVADSVPEDFINPNIIDFRADSRILFEELAEFMLACRLDFKGLHDEKPIRDFEKYNAITALYLLSLQMKESCHEAIEKLDLSDAERELFNNYLDPITSKIINTPVRLHDKVMDLDTFLKMQSMGLKTKAISDKLPDNEVIKFSDLEPASDVLEEMREIVENIKQQRQHASVFDLADSDSDEELSISLMRKKRI